MGLSGPLSHKVARNQAPPTASHAGARVAQNSQVDAPGQRVHEGPRGGPARALRSDQFGGVGEGGGMGRRERGGKVWKGGKPVLGGRLVSARPSFWG